VEKLRQNRVRAGILIADVSGHRITDALMAAMLHQAFLLGVRYELSMFGEVTTGLFENINTRFVNSSSISKFITMIYGEICESGMFYFVTAGHPDPVVFSNKYDKISTICSDRVVHFPPVGTMPVQEDIDLKHTPIRLGYKKKYAVNEINLMGKGDILLLYTDGLRDHHDSRNRSYFSSRLEGVIQGVKDDSAADIFSRVKEDLLAFAPCEDDVSLVVIKKLR
jgi:serine phosphatase RsbU (regulator of sigma subunit)